MKFDIYIFIQELLPGYEANKIAKIEMANAFLKIKEINNVYFYFLSNFITKIMAIRYAESVLNNRIVLKMLIIPFLKDGKNRKRIVNFLRYVIANRIIFIRYFILFLFKNFGKSIIFIRDDFCLFACWFASFFKKIKYNCEIHNFEFGNNKFKDLIFKSVMKRSNKIITISNYTKQGWIKNGINENKIIVFPSSVNLDLFNKVKDKKSLLKKKIGLKDNKKIVLYSGQLHDWKGIDTLINSFKFYRNNENILLYILGGSEQDIIKYKILVKKLEIKNIIFLGNKEHKDISKYLKCSDILIIPNTSKKNISYFHTSPIKLFEYMASKVPIIASDLPSMRQIVSEKEVFFFKPDCPKDLFNKMNYIFNNYKEAKKKALKSYSMINRFTWDKRAKTIINEITTNY